MSIKSLIAAIAAAGWLMTPAQATLVVESTDFAVTASNFNSNNPNRDTKTKDFTYVSPGVYTYATNPGSNSDMLVVAVGSEHGGGSYTLSFEGVSMTLAETSSSGSGAGGSGAAIWYLQDPSATGNIEINFSATTINGFGIGIASLSNESGGIILQDTAKSTNSDEVNLTVTGDDAFVMFSGDANTTTGSPTIDQPLTAIYTQSDVGSSQPGAGYENNVTAGLHNYSWSPAQSPRGVVAASFVAIPETSALALLGLAGIIAVACSRFARRSTF